MIVNDYQNAGKGTVVCHDDSDDMLYFVKYNTTVSVARIVVHSQYEGATDLDRKNNAIAKATFIADNYIPTP